MPTKPAPLVSVAFRLPADLVAQIDEHAERLNIQHPEMRATRGDAARELLGYGVRVAAARARAMATVPTVEEIIRSTAPPARSRPTRRSASTSKRRAPRK